MHNGADGSVFGKPHHFIHRIYQSRETMNKKSTRNKPRRPAETMTPASHDAATIPGDDTTPGASDPADVAATVPVVSTPAARPSPKPHEPVTFSITLPGNAAQLLDQLRQTHGTVEKKLKKSVLLRAALLALAETDPDRIAAIVAGLDKPQDAVAKPRKSRKNKFDQTT